MLSLIIQTSDESCAALGQRVRQLRLQQNLTQSELGGRAGVSFGAVRKLEASGRTTLSTFVKCVQALGATGELEKLLKPEPRSIAEWEAGVLAGQRRRARRPHPPRPVTHE
ncbi:MAG: XRE family transcriptional regulator [Betaproteobacteria bacterium]|nr:XRE family transcriptional regulator [Betaproteobacteria bacterium]